MVTSVGVYESVAGSSTDQYFSVTTHFTPVVGVHLRGLTMMNMTYLTNGIVEIDDVMVAGPQPMSGVFRVNLDVVLVAGRRHKVVLREQASGRVRVHRTSGIPVYPILGALDPAPEFNTVAAPAFEFHFDEIPVQVESDTNIVDDEPGRLAFGFAMDPRKGRWVVDGMGLTGGGGSSSLIAADRVYYGDLLIAQNG